MKTSTVIAAGLVGTTAMTLFSFLASGIKKRNFKEPDLLAGLVDDFLPGDAKKAAAPLGFAGHYAVGMGWAAAHLYALERLHKRPTLANALATGPLYGLLGAAIWKAQLSAHPNPPKTNYLRYYGHLVLAHTVFTIAVNLVAENAEKAAHKQEENRYSPSRRAEAAAAR